MKKNPLAIAYQKQVSEAINRMNQQWGDNLTNSQKNYIEALQWNEKNCEKWLKVHETTHRKSKNKFKKEDNEINKNISPSETNK